MESDPNPSFGRWLKKQRKALDLTQEELAERVGCATISIQSIEAGKRRPSKQIAELLARQLSIPEHERQEFIKFARSGADEDRLDMDDRPGLHALQNLFSHKLTNLPAQLTPLIGREQDVVAAQKRLLNEDTRLLTLIGPPGVGKTRLAIQIAFSLADEFEDGAHFISLESVTDPIQVAPVIAQTLGVNQVGGRMFSDRLKEYLRDKHILLVLDNFEQVTTAASLVSDLLSACPWLSILVTSRTPLRIRGERQFRVAPLELPDDSWGKGDIAQLLGYSAVKLFLDRAQAITPDFTLTPENAVTVAAICRRLDGLPLAIELAAARTNLVPLATLLAQLKGRDILHTKGFRDVSERHHSLHNAIDWSYALLSDDEQELLALSVVFVDGWTLAAMERLMEDRPPHVVANSFISLVGNNLVVQQRDKDEPRYRLLETIREYATERLVEKDEVDAVRQRHAEYYLTLAEQADPYLRTASQQLWLERLDLEHGNFQAALVWFIDHTGDIEKGMRLAGALGWFWILRSYVSEGRGWLERALYSGKNIQSAARVKVLNAAGSLAWEQGDLIHARTYLEESIALCRELGPGQTWDLAMALGNYGNVVMYQGDQTVLQRAAEESYALFDQLEDQWGKGLALCLIGEWHLLKHDYVHACACYEEAASLLRKTGDKWATGVSLMDWGYTCSLLGNLTSARKYLEESIALHRAVGERFVRSLSLNILAKVVQQQDDTQLTFALYGESLDLLRKMGIEASIADVQYNLASFIQAQGNHRLAEKLYNDCLHIFSDQGNEEGIAKCRAGLAALTKG